MGRIPTAWKGILGGARRTRLGIAVMSDKKATQGGFFPPSREGKEVKGKEKLRAQRVGMASRFSLSAVYRY